MGEGECHSAFIIPHSSLNFQQDFPDVLARFHQRVGLGCVNQRERLARHDA
jgi:hypothetical protein